MVQIFDGAARARGAGNSAAMLTASALRVHDSRMHGVLVIDKPAGLTSHDVVNRIRRFLHERSVGHLGTLDPLATGVLPLVVGRMTRLAQFYNASDKKYEGEIRFGLATDTYDSEGEPVGESQPVKCSAAEVRNAAQRFVGMIEQMPPRYSAKKIGGVPAYKLARKNREVILEPVQVEIKEFAILAFDGERATFRAHVSSGTYMRAVAHEMGAQLGCGAHLSALRRTGVGEFSLEDARTLEEVEAAAKAEEEMPGQLDPPPMDRIFVHPRKVLPQVPSVTATDETVAAIRNGRAVNLPEFSRAPQVKVFYGENELVAIASRVAGTLFHPKIVFADAEKKQVALRR
ncbi:MAG TPA: tRNA pseudouridine(55) synthase TruB [Terriglobales bacterium]|nr:tRNA pseudouridine(55) synthase TruB [Terriglobales bacterium]